jgi:hypothetical protein
MLLLFTILGLMFMTAIFMALDEAPWSRKLIPCLIGGMIFGSVPIVLFAIAGAMVSPAPINSTWELVLFVSLLGGIAGGIAGAVGGGIVFALSMLIRFVFLTQTASK